MELTNWEVVALAAKRYISDGRQLNEKIHRGEQITEEDKANIVDAYNNLIITCRDRPLKSKISFFEIYSQAYLDKLEAKS